LPHFVDIAVASDISSYTVGSATGVFNVTGMRNVDIVPLRPISPSVVVAVILQTEITRNSGRAARTTKL